MLTPKKVKHRKHQKGRIRGKAGRGNSLSFGRFGLKALEGSRLTARQIEAARRAITRLIQKQGKVWIRIFPDKPVTKKPAETRMGSGKGPVEFYVADVQAGRVIFEMDGISEKVAREALRLASHKLPIKTIFINE